jgi:hypothetical protein
MERTHECPGCKGTKVEISYCLDSLGRVEFYGTRPCGMCCGTGLVDKHTAEFFRQKDRNNIDKF